MTIFIEKAIFILRIRLMGKLYSTIRCFFFVICGMKIGKGTIINSLHTTWPHKIKIGNNCRLEHGIYFKYDGIWSKNPSIIIDDEVFIGSYVEFNCNCLIKIGKYTNIASGCRLIDHDHGIEYGNRIGGQPSVKKEIVLGEDVWLGCNSVILKGVTIGNGAVIAAGAVVTKSIPENEVWGGVPAKFIRIRK